MLVGLRSRWRQLCVEAGAVTLLTGLLTWLVLPSVGRPGTFFRPVLLNWFGPEKHGVADRLADGDLPLWSRSAFGGEPLLANMQHGVLYPLNLPFWVVRTSLALEISVVLHLVLAALGAWVLCRIALRTGPWGAAVAALAFGLGSFTLAHIVLLNQLHVIAWVPWVLCFTHLALTRSTWPWVALLGLSVAMQVLAGHPEELVYTLVLVALYGVAWLVGQGRAATIRGALTGAGRLAGGVAMGALLSAAQLLPTLHLLGLGYRSTPGNGGENALPQALGLNALLPDFGALLRDELTASAGVAVLVLAALGLTARGRPLPWVRAWCGALCAVGFVLALGSQTPAFRVVSAVVPLLGDFRFPLRWLMLPVVALPILAAFGVDALLAARTSEAGWRPHLLHLAAAAGALLVAGAAVLVLSDATMAPDSWRWWAGAAVVTFAMAALAKVERIPAAAVGVALVALVALEVGTQRPDAEYTLVAPDSVYDEAGPLLDRLGEEGGRYAAIPGHDLTNAELDDARYPYRLATATQDEIVALTGLANRLQGYPNAQTMTGAETYLGRDGGLYPTRRLAEWNEAVHGLDARQFNNGNIDLPPSAWRDDALALLGVQWWLTPYLSPDEQAVLEAQGFEPVDQEQWVTLWRRDGVDVAHLVHDVEVVPDADERLDRLADPDLALTETALVEQDLDVEPEPLGTDATPDQVEVVTREPERLVVETASEEAALLVVADPAYPGWEVTVDGEPAELVTVDHAFHGVALDAGEHTVELQYHEPRFWLGLWASGITVLALLGITAWQVVKGRRGEDEHEEDAGRTDPAAGVGAGVGGAGGGVRHD